MLGVIRIAPRQDRLSLFSSRDAGPWPLARSIQAPAAAPERVCLAVSGSTAAAFFFSPSEGLSVLRAELG